MDLVEYISCELDQNKYVIVVFIDLKKAFDTVDIDHLLDKLYKMGFRGTCYNLLKSYSEGRKHYTVVNNCESDCADIKVGVAQGSVLGPLLYLLYVHSIRFLQLKSRYFMYADDTVLVMSGNNVDHLELDINSDLNLYFDWLCHNRLSMNLDKSVYMIVKQKNKKPCNIEVKIKNTPLKEVSEYVYLGLTINNRLSWDSHIQKLATKIAPIIGSFRRCNYMLNNKVRGMLYCSFFESHLRYLITCWGNTSKHSINKIQRMQNKGVKALYAMDFYTPTKEVYDITNILDIYKLKHLEQAKFIYCIKNNILKSEGTKKLNEVGQLVHYQFRDKAKIRKEFARTKIFHSSPLNSSISMYNKIPSNITEISNYYKMLHCLKQYIKEYQYL